MKDKTQGGPSRRGFLGGVGAAGVLGVGGAYGISRATESSAATSGIPKPGQAVPFYGRVQAGITTPAQDKVMIAGFDLTTKDVGDVKELLRNWTAAAARMTAGDTVGPTDTAPLAPPMDTGEALDLPPSGLTITVGFGASLFDDRFGLKSRRPAALVDLPEFETDRIEAQRSDGDIVVQACAYDPQVAYHAIRNFARIARGVASLRFSQLGFNKATVTSTKQYTPRNLMGFKDGTNNPKGENETDMNTFVWVGDETDQPWMRGGSYMVMRRIRMLIEFWDAQRVSEQEDIFGRKRLSGAPLTGTEEFDHVDLTAAGSDGPIIPADAHIRLANPDSNGGQKIFRRSYSYTDGLDQTTGQLDAGLLFIAYQKDARKAFIRINQKFMDGGDRLNPFLRHTSSGHYACPPGIKGPGDWWGSSLFA